MTSLFSFLRNDLKVTPLDDGNQVEVTLTLPADLVFLYLRFLDSMTGIVQTVDCWPPRSPSEKTAVSDALVSTPISQRSLFDDSEVQTSASGNKKSSGNISNLFQHHKTYLYRY